GVEGDRMATRKEVYDAVDNVKEYLALNKWNEAMMLMAQISIEVIENLTDEALIVSKGYEEDLKTLLAGGFINDATAHNLETLIVSGVQAHNGVDIPSDYVKKALTVLEDELKVVFDNNINVSTTDGQKEKALSNAEKVKEPSFVYDESENVKEGYEDDEPAFINKDGDIDFRVKEKLRRESFNNVPLKAGKLKISRLIAIVIPIVLIIVIAIFIRGCMKNNTDDIKNAQTYQFATSETAEQTVESTEETGPTEPPEAGMWNVMGDVVWIRDQANTTSSRKLARVDKGDQVRVIRIIDGVDRKWAIINYDGKEAFIARDYIDPTDEVRNAMKRVTAETTTAVETSADAIETRQ
ncbi:MAG: SH3 domain-containing protein, partial [Lachnospiraceae bacterium]|nr:SH3 domain-containing protein [Lachnospiraceae bacterium]